jgi:hypothetical protein
MAGSPCLMREIIGGQFGRIISLELASLFGWNEQ